MNLNQLKEAKKKSKLTLQQISDISGIPKRTVDDIFSGHTKNPRIDTMQAIENALFNEKSKDWTDEEQALGVGNHPTYLSEDEYELIELRSEIIRIHGEGYWKTLETMMKALINVKPEK